MAIFKHYGIEAWADFARDVLPAERAREMLEHLTQGCKSCSRVASLWKRVYKVAQDEGRFQPPERLVRSVKSSVAMNLPKPGTRLLFDSFREPLPALIRSTATATRHLIYQAGTVLLDVETERQSDGGLISLVGQLVCRSRQKKDLSNVAVQVTLMDRVIAETLTNQFGEFHFEFESEGAEAFRLRALIKRGRTIDIPLVLTRI